MATMAHPPSSVMDVKKVADIPKEMWWCAMLLEQCMRPHVIVQSWNEEVLQHVEVHNPHDCQFCQEKRSVDFLQLMDVNTTTFSLARLYLSTFLGFSIPHMQAVCLFTFPLIHSMHLNMLQQKWYLLSS
jgi:hypothetical protein